MQSTVPHASLASAPASGRDRLRWLDTARAVAAASVALMHLTAETSPALQRFYLRIWNPGAFGVMVFFLVSGFVIPLSLERRGSLLSFAVGRFFRLYPLYWASLLTVVVLYKLRLGYLSPELRHPLIANALWNATMLQHWVGVPDAVGLYWSLAFELVFYAATAALFALRLHRRTDWLVALATVYFSVHGVILPLFTRRPGFAADEFCLLSFFVGTLWYRGWASTISTRQVVWITLSFIGSVAGSLIVTHGLLGVRVDPAGMQRTAEAGAWAAAYAAFALLLWTGAGSRSRVFPWVGRVSYSIYLVHGVLLLIPLHLPPAATFAVRLIVLLPVCELSYRYVEASGIAAGQAVLRWLGTGNARVK